jgi:hypothetical protein
MTLDGKGDQYWLTKKYQKYRRKGLRDRSIYTDAKLTELDLNSDVSLGAGKTDERTYEFKQSPYPMNQSIRKRQTLDIRDEDPTVGD